MYMSLTQVTSTVRSCRGSIFGTSRYEGAKTWEENLLWGRLMEKNLCFKSKQFAAGSEREK